MMPLQNLVKDNSVNKAAKPYTKNDSSREERSIDRFAANGLPPFDDNYGNPLNIYSALVGIKSYGA